MVKFKKLICSFHNLEEEEMSIEMSQLRRLTELNRLGILTQEIFEEFLLKLEAQKENTSQTFLINFDPTKTTGELVEEIKQANLNVASQMNFKPSNYCFLTNSDGICELGHLELSFYKLAGAQTIKTKEEIIAEILEKGLFPATLQMYLELLKKYSVYGKQIASPNTRTNIWGTCLLSTSLPLRHFYIYRTTEINNSNPNQIRICFEVASQEMPKPLTPWTDILVFKTL